MSIEDLSKIDLITVTCEGIVPSQVILVITDHLQWSEYTNDHLYQLQEKINKYIEFVERNVGKISRCFGQGDYV
ncbi:TPA: hypothetical protein IGZ61_004646 [Escherichia coli]|nr:hypothetical protein [Escherichia coli]